ncbi:MAG TPA: hypothetical protein VGM82_02300 [Gemmatimonadaceae bacterium]|jgi:hypothetical protein
MRRFLAPRGGDAAGVLLLLVMLVVMLVRPVSAGAQAWNDPRSRWLVEGATQRRTEQLADTALRDYQAIAHGYVAFLAQLGEGLRTPPKVIKTDELEDEVYWKAPNLSKQRIVGRRDTLLLPTDIAYHTDHLGIVQNNFPDVIRIGDGGDEVKDVPHPLSAVGLNAYDFALADSFSIGSGAQRINVYEVRVRPKVDTLPRVVGAVYIDQSSRQVVRLNLTFTHAAFLDKALEDLSLVLENRLVAGRFWLPSRQEVEIRRKGEWLDYPARAIIRGRWEIGEYKINQSPSPALFAGPEIVQAPANVLAAHKWGGNILDSLPADVRAISEEDIERVKEDARAIVRAQALASAKAATLSGRRIEDFVRFNRVEGLALGVGLNKQLGAGWWATVRGRYGIDDKLGKGSLDVSKVTASGFTYQLFAMRDFRDVSDVAERSGVVNSLAAQEFGSDYTDPYLARAVGANVIFPTYHAFDIRLEGSYELDDPLAIHADPVRGTFLPTIQFEQSRAARALLSATRPLSPWIGNTDLSLRGEVRTRFPIVADAFDASYRHPSVRAIASADLEKPLGASTRLVTSALVGGMHVETNGVAPTPAMELVYLGGPISAPGYDYHSQVATFGYSGRVELRLPAPFPGFSLGRYGRVPGRATFAPFVNLAGTNGGPGRCLGASVCNTANYFLPALGAGYLTPFDLIRIDVARGVGRNGRWTFAIDVTRDFWSIL